MPEKMIGMYIHQHWPYNHPYAARTWSTEDWQGFAEGLSRLGYNALLLWPMLETMPNPLTQSDEAYLQKTSKVIDLLHDQFGMRVFIALCPNVGAVDEVAARFTVEDRHFFYCDVRINPGDPSAVDEMIRWRERLLQPLKAVDGVTIIDSDPGGYPGSTTAEFVNLLAEHRKMLDRLRPGIELYYWMHAGWQAYCRFYETGEFSWGLDEEFEDALRELERLNPEPWGIANGFVHAEKLGLEEKVMGYNYGAIEGEPSFPFTNFGGDAAYQAGAAGLPRGVLGNAQTHCVQLPNIFAFVRGAKGNPVALDDYVQFADEVIQGKGEVIVESWQTLAGNDPEAMLALAERLEHLERDLLPMGKLKGLLLGSPGRFIDDLMLQLRVKAYCEEFCSAVEGNRRCKDALSRFIRAAEIWQLKHGYKNRWEWPRLKEALKALESPVLNEAIEPTEVGTTPFDRVKFRYLKEETHTLRLLEAMKKFQASIG